MTRSMAAPPANSPRTRPRRLRLLRERKAAGRAKEQVERMFIKQPRGPVSLMVSISRRETATEVRRTAIGPRRTPPRVIRMSLGSYFKNNTTGTRPKQTAA
jgi:hypothetical protein